MFSYYVIILTVFKAYSSKRFGVPIEIELLLYLLQNKANIQSGLLIVNNFSSA